MDAARPRTMAGFRCSRFCERAGRSSCGLSNGDDTRAGSGGGFCDIVRRSCIAVEGVFDTGEVMGEADDTGDEAAVVAGALEVTALAA